MKLMSRTVAYDAIAVSEPENQQLLFTLIAHQSLH